MKKVIIYSGIGRFPLSRALSAMLDCGSIILTARLFYIVIYNLLEVEDRKIVILCAGASVYLSFRIIATLVYFIFQWYCKVLYDYRRNFSLRDFCRRMMAVTYAVFPEFKNCTMFRIVERESFK